jgi:Protein of unknown function (DUF2652)
VGNDPGSVVCYPAGTAPRGEVEMDTKQGFLVLADISGFTALVTATELEHGPAIIADLLEAVIRRISPPLDIQGIEGDAVFALGTHGTIVPPARLLDVLRTAFDGFRERQQALIDSDDDSCSCNACLHVGRLRLKAIDVILVHRLLKNQVPQKDDHYTLFTRPALQYMDVDPARLGLQPHTESYEHFGDVECFFGTSTCGV